MHAILETVFPFRIRAVKSLMASLGPSAAADLDDAAEGINEILLQIHDEQSQSDWQALREALLISAKLCSWYEATQAGEVDADRFLRAAQLKLSEWQTSDSGYGHELKSLLTEIESGFSAPRIKALLDSIAYLPFPVSIFTKEAPIIRPGRTGTEKPESELAIAFLEFRIDGKNAEAVHRLPAGQLLDLELKLRISRWPDGAERLILRPVSVEPEDIWILPEFDFKRPQGEPPFTLDAFGRLSIKTPMSLGARPLEFLYSAEFLPTDAEQPVAVAGQRSLRLDSSAVHEHVETGYQSLDAKLIELRNRLRDEPRISEREIETALHLFKPLANLVGQSLQDNLFPVVINESKLEEYVIRHLRSHPEIGVELEVQAHSSGGRTDVSFRQMRVELKVKNNAPINDNDLTKYAQQAAAYAVGSDKTIAPLCILDGSQKTKPALPMAEAIRVIPVQPGDRPIYVIAFILQGRLAKPSSLSR